MSDDTPGREQPTAIVPGAESVLVAPAVSAAKYLYDAWKEGRPAITPSDPLTFGVASTVTETSGHTLILNCSNLGAHGVYLEGISVVEPHEIEASALVVPAIESINQPHFLAKDECLPILLPSGSEAVLRVRLSALPADRMQKKPYGQLSVAYTVAGVASSGLKKQVAFAIRPSAEPAPPADG